ncbi:MAG TPA: hypothetical protein VHS56_14255 [Candidatus Cybelea sp.]|jgi:hypothetical protein|nr:hypothetical protein [Candidatus Cybelea sp.]
MAAGMVCARSLAVWGAFVASCTAFAAAQATPGAAPTSSPAPSLSAPTAAPSRALGLSVKATFATTFLDQTTSGPGQIGPEAPPYLNGAPLAPNTPYDLFSTAPLTPGIAALPEALMTLTERTKTLDLSLDTGLEYVGGSITNAVYWGESTIPTLNPHMGSQALPYAIAFPTAPGQDDGSNFRLSILGGSIATADGNLALKFGYFDLAQTERFVFAQPPLPSVNPAIAYAPAETLSSGLPGSDDFVPLVTQLSLDGVEALVKKGMATFELSTAALPSPPGLSARATIGSLIFDRGEGTTYSAQVVHASTSGIDFTTSAAFGAHPWFFYTPQGVIAESTLRGQQQTIAGASANVHVMPRWNLDGTVELARSWYDAQNVAPPGTASGGYYHVGLQKRFGRATASADAYRMEPNYATIVLPYGIAENQWGATWAWPAPWLGSSYQLVDNTVVSTDRQGYRLRYFLDGGPLEVHAEFADFRQIRPTTTLDSQQTGFVGGYFPAELPAHATLGTQKRYGFWATWRARFGDLTFDFIDDQFDRRWISRLDNVDVDIPQYVVTYSRHFTPRLVVAFGTGRYAMNGTFAQPIEFHEQLLFAGAIFKETAQASILATVRRNLFAGIPSYPPLPISPDFTGTQLIVEQRYTI